MGVSTSPAQSRPRRSTPSQKIEDIAGESPRLQGAGTPRYMLEQLSSTTHKARNLALTLKLELV